MIIPRGRRRLDRKNIPIEEWRGLTDDDLDENERQHEALREFIREAVGAATAPLQRSQDKTNYILLTLTLTVAGGLLLAIATNLLTK